jgi:hypothetical protein
MKRFSGERLGFAALGLAGLVSGPARASCGQSYCVIKTSWYSQGIPADAGCSRLDLRYEAIVQHQLIQGIQKVSADEATGHRVDASHGQPQTPHQTNEITLS